MPDSRSNRLEAETAVVAHIMWALLFKGTDEYWHCEFTPYEERVAEFEEMCENLDTVPAYKIVNLEGEVRED